jgi:phasin family protein
MPDETKVEAQAAAEAPAKVAEAVAETVETVVKESAKVARRTRAAATRRVKREAAVQKRAAKSATRRNVRKTRKPARKAAAAQQRIETVTKNAFNGFDAIPAFAPFQNIFAEAKSPTEYLQLQGDFARASFDRMVAESSKLTESLVKLAGMAFQPLSNRATANAERINNLVA